PSPSRLQPKNWPHSSEWRRLKSGVLSTFTIRDYHHGSRGIHGRPSGKEVRFRVFRAFRGKKEAIDPIPEPGYPSALMKIAINGAGGRMGSTVGRLALAAGDIEI